MVLEVAQVGEALAALVAHVLLLSRVDLQVGLQAVALVEAAAALLTAEGLLARVDALVAVQVARVAEAFAASAAAERLLPRVDHLGANGRDMGRIRQCVYFSRPLCEYMVVLGGN